MNIALWIAQSLLAVFYILVGGIKTFRLEMMKATREDVINGPSDTALRISGIAELFGAFGLTLPMLTGIFPWLSPLAAIGLIIIQLLAIFTVYFPTKDFKSIPITAVLLTLLIFIVIGRWELFMQ